MLRFLRAIGSLESRRKRDLEQAHRDLYTAQEAMEWNAHLVAFYQRRVAFLQAGASVPFWEPHSVVPFPNLHKD